MASEVLGGSDDPKGVLFEAGNVDRGLSELLLRPRHVSSPWHPRGRGFRARASLKGVSQMLLESILIQKV